MSLKGIMLPNVTQSFELEGPDLESCRAEGMLRLFIAERCFYAVDHHELFHCMKTCNHLKEIVMNCVCIQKNEIRCSYVAQKVKMLNGDR